MALLLINKAYSLMANNWQMLALFLTIRFHARLSCVSSFASEEEDDEGGFEYLE
jgi:hypothetical protein